MSDHGKACLVTTAVSVVCAVLVTPPETLLGRAAGAPLMRYIARHAPVFVALTSVLVVTVLAYKFGRWCERQPPLRESLRDGYRRLKQWLESDGDGSE